MKNVLKAMFAIVIALGLALTANAQQPVDPKTGKPFTKTAPTKTTKPMTESEWLKQNQPKTKSTADNQPVTQPQPIVIQEPVRCYPPQPVYNTVKAVDMQWIRKMVNGKKYTIKLTFFPQHNGQNMLQVTVEDSKSMTIQKTLEFFNIAEDMENPELEQSSDWKKLIFTYEVNGITIPIEIENLY